MLTYSTKPRGSVVVALHLAEALHRLGHDAHLLALGKGGDSFYRDVRCPLRLFAAGPAPRDINDLIHQRIDEVVAGLAPLGDSFEVLHAQDCLVGSALIKARRRTGSRALVVRTVHHVEAFESPYLAECQRRSIVEADVLISVSQATRQEVWEKFGRRSEAVDNGVDVERFAGSIGPAQRDRERRRLGLAPEDFVLLSVGGVEPRKNSLSSLEAVARVMRCHARLRWVIVGGHSILDHGEYQRRFARQLAELPKAWQARVELRGTLDEADLTAYYRASDALLCPSTREGWGLCVLEALAAELPVVASNRPPFTEYLSRDTACLVEPDDARSIAAAVRELIEAPGLLRRLAGRGREVCSRYSWVRSACRHSEVYARALLRKAGDLAAQVAAAPPPPPFVPPPHVLN